jgi:hypothetical protein
MYLSKLGYKVQIKHLRTNYPSIKVLLVRFLPLYMRLTIGVEISCKYNEVCIRHCRRLFFDVPPG